MTVAALLEEIQNDPVVSAPFAVMVPRTVAVSIPKRSTSSVVTDGALAVMKLKTSPKLSSDGDWVRFRPIAWK